MPRRKEGLDYELLPRPTKGEDGRPLLYARPAVGIRYSMSSLEAFCHQHRGMHYGEMTRALEVFLDVATILMEDGARIETPFGTFAPKLRLDGDYTDPDKVTGNNVHYAGVEFRPSQQFVEPPAPNSSATPPPWTKRSAAALQKATPPSTASATVAG